MNSLTFPESKNLKFISELVDALSHSLISEVSPLIEEQDIHAAVHELLLNAAEPIEFIQDKDARSISAELMQRPVDCNLDTIKALFANSTLPTLTQSLALRLISWFEHERGLPARWQNLNFDEQKAFLYIACNTFSSLESRFSAEQFLKYLALKYVPKKGQLADDVMLQSCIQIVLLQGKFCYELRCESKQAIFFLNGGLDVLNDLKPMAKDSLLYLECEQVLSGKLGDLYSEHVYPKLARKLCERSVEISEHILNKFGKTPARLQDLAISFGRLANFDALYGDADTAEKGYSQSLTIIEQQITEFGETPERMQYVISLLSGLADLYSNKARIAALACLTGAIAISERQISKFGETAKRLEELFYLYHLLPFHGGGSKASSERYNFIVEKTLTTFGETPYRLSHMNFSLLSLGQYEKCAGNHNAARCCYLRCLHLNEKLISQYSESVACLASPLELLAELEDALGNFSAAKEYYLRWFDCLKNSLLAPDEIKRMLAVMTHLATKDEAAGDVISARACYLRIEALRRSYE